MPTIDPKVAFWFGLTLFMAGIIGNAGPAFLAGAIPAVAIPIIIKWCSIMSTLGNGAMTYAAGSAMTNAGRLANVKPVPLPQKMDNLITNNPAEVKSIITTPAIAAETQSEKIVSPPNA